MIRQFRNEKRLDGEDAKEGESGRLTARVLMA